MTAIICDLCKQPLTSDSDICDQQGYRFKGSFVCIRTSHFGRRHEVEEAATQYDLCQGCYNKVRSMCEEGNKDVRESDE